MPPSGPAGVEDEVSESSEELTARCEALASTQGGSGGASSSNQVWREVPSDIEEEEPPAWTGDLNAWTARSGVHARVWNLFSRECRSSEDDPIMVNEQLVVIFNGAPAATLRGGATGTAMES